ncbi:hypothetical protein D0962_34375 [Leptolyngbyaceae cyanobacterium CCMR0082]|uniref:Bro-N domain-containing protein n=1 Tax=Adonisia turfae CCMR0082 TaxID=2304604 RepID=A0A6M0SHH7_9CYAN|nr:BRO family protein [Adonisia turfae]NEZ67786.1 hypothetical protein [Adonisia turfae CCMR0082]
MSEISLFDFQGYQIRHVGTADEPEWVGADVVAVLRPEAEARDRTTYLKGILSEWKGRKKVPTLGGPQEMTTVYEPGLYALIARSNSPLAIPFQKWVYEEVLPSIRETGSYGVTEKPSILDINRANKRIESLHGKSAARRHYWEAMSKYYPGLAGDEPVDEPQLKSPQSSGQPSDVKFKEIDLSVQSFVEKRLKLLSVHPEVSEPKVSRQQMIDWYVEYCHQHDMRPVGFSHFIHQLKALTPRHFRPRRRCRVGETTKRDRSGKLVKMPAHWVCIELANYQSSLRLTNRSF